MDGKGEFASGISVSFSGTLPIISGLSTISKSGSMSSSSESLRGKSHLVQYKMIETTATRLVIIKAIATILIISHYHFVFSCKKCSWESLMNLQKLF